MEFEQFYNSLPKFTRFYLISVFVVTLCISLVRFLPVFYWIHFNWDFITDYYQIWRLFTNFFIVGKFSFNFLFFMMMIYGTLSRLEKKAVENKRYAEFVMLLVYNVCFVLVVSLLMYYLFGMELKSFMTFELLFALIYVEAKRDPDKLVMVWMLTVKNAYLPWVLMFFSLVTGGDIVSDLIGIAAGHLYLFLKDLAPLNYGYDILKTPQFLFDYFDRTSARSRVSPSTTSSSQIGGINNPNTSGSFGSQAASSTTFRTESNQGSGNRFEPFTGRGASWGN